MKVTPADLLSALNAALGILAIILLIRFYPNTSYTIFLILVAVFVDGMDGIVARYTGTSSERGAVVDSAADSVSFCLAPAALILATYFGFYKLNGVDVGRGLSTAVMALSALTASIYACCGIFRLLRFVRRDLKLKHFRGLSTPAGAITVILITRAFQVQESPLPSRLLPFTAFLFIISISLLMVSNLPYPKIGGRSGIALAAGVFIPMGIFYVLRRGGNTSSAYGIYAFMLYSGLALMLSYALSPFLFMRRKRLNG